MNQKCVWSRKKNLNPYGHLEQFLIAFVLFCWIFNAVGIRGKMEMSHLPPEGNVQWAVVLMENRKIMIPGTVTMIL